MQIYVFEDRQANREVYKEYFESTGHNAVIFANTKNFLGSQPVEVAKTLGLSDAVITDQRMPGIFGSDLIEFARQGGYNKPMALISAYPCAKQIVADLQNKYPSTQILFLEKGSGLTKLDELVEQMLSFKLS